MRLVTLCLQPCYPESPQRCGECFRLIAARQEQERKYLAALGNFTAAVGEPETEYTKLRALVDLAEAELELADIEIGRHWAQSAVPAPQRTLTASATQ